MKKQSIILFISILISFSVQAQRKLKQLDEEEAKNKQQYEESDKKGFFNRDKWTFGGNVFGGYYNGIGFFSAQPLVGYRLKEKTIVGVGATYLYQGNKNYNLSAYGPVVFAKQQIFEQLFLQVQYQPINRPAILNGYIDPKIPRVWEQMLYVGGGYGSRKGVYVSALYNVLWNQNNSIYSSPLQLSIGIMF